MKFHQHSNQVFSKHADSLRHKATKKIKLKSKGNIYKQTCDYEKKQSQEKRDLTRQIIKKIFKMTNFIARKKWAVREKIFRRY